MMGGETEDRGRQGALSPVKVWLFSFYGLLLWASLSAVSAARPLRRVSPMFLDTPNNVTAVVGSDVILPCSVHNLGPKTVIWKKISQSHPISIGEYVYDPDSRFKVVRKDEYSPANNFRPGYENPMWNLKISNVNQKHAGTFQCQISTTHSLERNVTLHVIADKSKKQKKTGIQLTGTKIVEKGDTIDINCTATAIDYRPKGVDWFKDGSRLKTSNNIFINDVANTETNVLHSRLEIVRANMSNAGNYICRFSQLAVQSIKVIVLDKIYSRVLPFKPPYLAGKPKKPRGTVVDSFGRVISKGRDASEQWLGGSNGWAGGASERTGGSKSSQGQGQGNAQGGACGVGGSLGVAVYAVCAVLTWTVLGS